MTDPYREKAIREGRWLVKEYHDELGCVDVKYGYDDTNPSIKFWLQKWIQQRLLEIPLNMRYDMSYRMFDPSGKEIGVKINWVPQIVLEEA